MAEPLRVLSAPFSGDELLTREWLVTNGLGGYASGTLDGRPTRRYHGLLVAALPAPLGRVMMLNCLSETLRLPDRSHVALDGAVLAEFRLDEGLPVWRWRVGPHLVEKRVWMSHRANTTWVRYRLVEGDGPVRLRLHPAVHFRNHDAPVSEPLVGTYTLQRHRRPLGAERARRRLARAQAAAERRAPRAHPRDAPGARRSCTRSRSRAAMPSRGALVSPGHLRVDLDARRGGHAGGLDRALGGDRRARPRRRARRRARAAPAPARHRRADRGATRLAAELVLAADQFIISPAGRVEDRARARAAGDERAHRDRRLPLVHRLGPRHDDLASRA